MWRSQWTAYTWPGMSRHFGSTTVHRGHPPWSTHTSLLARDGRSTPCSFEGPGGAVIIIWQRFCGSQPTVFAGAPRPTNAEATCAGAR